MTKHILQISDLSASAPLKVWYLAVSRPENINIVTLNVGVLVKFSDFRNEIRTNKHESYFVDHIIWIVVRR